MFQRVLAKASVALATLLVLAVPAARAQDNCQAFRAIVPMTFNISTGWSGPVYAVMGAEVLLGKSSGDVPPQTVCDAVSCRDTGARSRMDFGGSSLMNPGDTLTLELQTAQYALPDGYAMYHAVWKIVGGTGRFAHASGVLFEAGPFVAWMDSKDVPQGSYLGEIDGTVCGATPHKNTAVLPFYRLQFSPSGRK
jgi:hypothetical protein